MFDFILLLVINILGVKFLGNWFLVFEIIALLVLLIYLWIKKYRPVVDNVSVFTGAPGTGKTALMTDLAIVKYKSILLGVKIRNWLKKQVNRLLKKKLEYEEMPILVSNYPIRLGKKKRKVYKNELKAYKNGEILNKPSKYVFSHVLTNDIVLLQERLPYKSVLVITEFSSIAHNQDFKNEYVKVNVDEFIRFIRQYTKGGYLFADDQSSDLILATIRRRIGKVYNMMEFRKIPLLKIGIVKIRHISISEDIKVVEEGHAESFKNTSWLPLFFYTKKYDTYAFSGRVEDMIITQTFTYQDFKTNQLMQLPYEYKKGANKPTLTKKNDTI